jgi:lipopolysaccharide heptosyltransferase II
LDFQGLLRSALIGLLARSPRRVGFRGAREGASLFYHEKVLLPANLRHAVERNLFLVRTALQAALPAESPELTCQPDLLKLANTLRQQYGLTGSGPVLAVAPAARWQSKMWPATFFAEVIDGVAGRLPEVQVWLLGTREEAAIGGAVMSACTKARPVDLTGETSTGVLMELLRQSSALLTNDTGPMHLAAALRVPTVALFGPTDPELTGPYGEQHVVLRGTCVRAPCFRDECSDAVCHASVPVSAAVDAVVARCLSRRMPTPSGPAAPPRAELQGVGASGLMPSVPRDSGWRAGHRQPGPLPF